MQVLHLWRVIGRLVKRHIGQLAVGNRNVEAIAHIANVVFAQLFGLVGGVFAFTGLAHAIALDGFDQQHRGLAGRVVVRPVEGGIHLSRIVATPAQGPNLVVRHFGHHLQHLGVAAKKVLAHKGAVVGLKSLVVTVQGVHHDLAQRAVFVFLQQRVPVAAPQQLDHAPARAPEFTFQLLNDFAVTPHRAIKALQVAVDHKHQVVQALTCGQANGAQALGLVHFAVAAEHPHLAVFGVGNAAGVQVLQKARLVNRHQRAQTHRHRGELPKLGHELGVGVARQALAIHLLPKVEQLLFAQAAF